jgi:hypothetical protein
VVADGVDDAIMVAVAVVAGDDPGTAGCERGGGRAPVGTYLMDVDLVHVGRQTVGDFLDELCRQGDPAAAAAAAACHEKTTASIFNPFFLLFIFTSNGWRGGTPHLCRAVVN